MKLTKVIKIIVAVLTAVLTAILDDEENNPLSENK